MQKRSPWMIVFRFVVGLSLATLFWWLVGTRLTIPAWQVAVLPAALLGFVIAYGEKRWSVLLAACIVAGVFTSQIVGEWFHVYGRLVAAREHSISTHAEESLLAAIAKLHADREAAKPADTNQAAGEAAKPADTNRAVGEVAKPADTNQATGEAAKPGEKKSEDSKPVDTMKEQQVEEPKVIIRLPPVDFMTAGRMACDRAQAEWIQHVVSLMLSLLIAGQAARMTIHSRAKQV